MNFRLDEAICGSVTNVSNVTIVTYQESGAITTLDMGWNDCHFEQVKKLG